MTVEFTARLPLARHELDRDAEFRTTPDLGRVLRDDPRPGSCPSTAPRAADADGSLLFVAAADVPEPHRCVYLGRSLADAADPPVGTPIVAALLDDDTASRSSRTTDGGATSGCSPPAQRTRRGPGGRGARHRELARLHRFSPRTGRPPGRRRAAGCVETDDGHEIFPRTDPAIIVGVTDADDRLLLGSNAVWEKNRYSLLAGFVEPGESLEQAVQREIFEESGVRVVDPEYLGSQPWPFPASLMVGFRARAVDGDPARSSPTARRSSTCAGSRREEHPRAAGDTVLLPGRSSIARAIIEDWYGGPLDLP